MPKRIAVRRRKARIPARARAAIVPSGKVVPTFKSVATDADGEGVGIEIELERR